MEPALTPKERLFGALTGRPGDVLPAAPCYLSLFLADFERAYYMELYRRHLRGRARCRVDHAQDTHFRAQALYQAYGIFKSPPDWLEVRPGISRAWAERTDISQRAGVLFYEDRRSGKQVPMHAIPMPSGDAVLSDGSASLQDIWDISGALTSPADIDAQQPRLSAEAWLARGDLDLPKQVVADYGDRYFISTILDTPYSEAYDWLGFQGLMLIQSDRPALFHHLLQHRLELARDTIAAWAATGVHGVFVEEVFTGADLISPRAYDQFVFAYNRPYFEHMRAAGLLPIHYVCGDVIPRLDRLAAYPLAAVAVEESKKNFTIDLAEVVRGVGERVAILGNIDAVRYGLHGTPADMVAEVTRQARAAAPARGFVVGTGSPFPLDTNPRQIDALVSTAHALPASAPRQSVLSGIP